MAGSGASYGLDKGFAVLSTYNTSNANGVERFKCVKLDSAGKIDVTATSADVCVGVVQENVDRTKVAADKAVADVRVAGISKVVAGAALAVGTRVMPGAGGTVLAATGASNLAIGIIVGGPSTLAGDIVEILLTPGSLAV